MIQTVTAQEAYDLLNKGEAILVDVREPGEFSGVHIPYAVSIPLAQVHEVVSALELPAGCKLLFHCQKGLRGEKACVAVTQSEHGDHEVLNMTGGIEAWEAAGLPLVRAGGSKGSGGPKISIFRQVQMIVGSLILILIAVGLTGLTFAFVLAGVFAGALAFAGVTGWCGLAMLLQKMPWNKP